MGEEQSPTMKYHYFHGRFTYSVKRSGPRRVWFLRGSRRRRGLDSCVEACAVRDGAGGFRGVLGPAAFRRRRVFGRFAIRSRRDGAYSVTRSGLKTVPDGEFDWGGTSVKR